MDYIEELPPLGIHLILHFSSGNFLLSISRNSCATSVSCFGGTLRRAVIQSSSTNFFRFALGISGCESSPGAGLTSASTDFAGALSRSTAASTSLAVGLPLDESLTA